MAHKTDFVRIGREGESVDGRPISGQDLVDMAETYSRDHYGARIWLEHFRGFIPGGIFDALGDVLSLKTEKVDGKTTLFAKLEALPQLVEWNKMGQKIFTSMEIFKNPETGKAYLGGLAVTDSPASLGTEALQLYSTLKRVNADHLYTTPLEFNLMQDPENKETPNNNQADPANTETPNVFTRVANMFSKKERTDDERFNAMENAIVLIAEKVQGFSAASAAAIVADPEDKNEPDENFSTLQAEYKELTTQFNELKKQLEEEPGNNFNRKPAAGGDGKELTTF